MWIGLHDTNMQMDFQWTDHTPVIFTFWHPFEPNNFRNVQEDCVSIWGAVSDPPLTRSLNRLLADARCQRGSSVCIYLTAVSSRCALAHMCRRADGMTAPVI